MLAADPPHLTRAWRTRQCNVSRRSPIAGEPVPVHAETIVTDTHRALPILLRICANIDRLFVIEVGPFGAQLAQDARTTWLASGNKVRPADVEQYVALLAEHIGDPERREAFIDEARQCIHV